MTSLKIFQVEKNNEDIRQTVLRNTIKMLTERNTLIETNLKKNIQKLISIRPDNNLYIIDKDKHKVKEKKQIAIKIFNTKITSISKQSIINDFLNKHEKYHKIIIVKAINTKTSQYITLNFPETEVFLEENLMINIIDNVLVPRYQILDEDSDEFKNFTGTYQCKKRNIPKLSINDPMAKYYNLKKGNIVRIIRPSETSAYSSYYRIVVH
jgi:DNA-directed RNA polymerase subunit H (RpoH/RPB5)